ncbi:glycosyltransferase [Sulfitobacter sp. 915]|uniref:glycosyltransferase n=1 Tax=Sulfitobacter sp. 915 TaxID=3368558 RepID=UPI0037466102
MIVCNQDAHLALLHTEFLNRDYGSCTLKLPSRWEAYGLVAIEALAAKRPLLVSGIDGLQNHIQKGDQAVKPGSDVER